MEWEVRYKIEPKAHTTYRERRGEFALMYVAIGTANPYETKILRTVETY